MEGQGFNLKPRCTKQRHRERKIRTDKRTDRQRQQQRERERDKEQRGRIWNERVRQWELLFGALPCELMLLICRLSTTNSQTPNTLVFCSICPSGPKFWATWHHLDWEAYVFLECNAVLKLPTSIRDARLSVEAIAQLVFPIQMRAACSPWQMRALPPWAWTCWHRRCRLGFQMN